MATPQIAMELVARYLEEHPEGATSEEIAAAVGRNPGHVRRTLLELRDEGRVTRHRRRGPWRLLTPGEAPEPYPERDRRRRRQPNAESIRPVVPLRLDRDQIAQAEALAAKRGVTRSQLLAAAIAAVLDRPEVLEESTTAA